MAAARTCLPQKWKAKEAPVAKTGLHHGDGPPALAAALPPDAGHVPDKAAHVMALERGAKILRVHDVAATADALKVWQATQQA